MGLTIVGIAGTFYGLWATIPGFLISGGAGLVTIVAAEAPPEYTCTELSAIKFATQQLQQEIASLETKITICVSHPLLTFAATGTSEACQSTTQRPFANYQSGGGFIKYSEEFEFLAEGVDGTKVCRAVQGGGLRAPLPGQPLDAQLFFAPEGEGDCSIDLTQAVRRGEPAEPPGETPTAASGDYGVLRLELEWLSAPLCGDQPATVTVTRYHRSLYWANTMGANQAAINELLAPYKQTGWIGPSVCTFRKNLSGTYEYILENVSAEEAQVEYDAIRERTKDVGIMPDLFWVVPEEGDEEPVEVPRAEIFGQ
jgi:hypothetical protein